MPLEPVHCWPVFSVGLWMERKGDSERDKKKWAEGAKQGTGFGGGLLAQLNCFHPQNDSQQLGQ